MRRTEVLQGMRWMKFEEIYFRARRRELTQAEAAEALGMSERTFRRWRDRYEADGAEGLYDRRLGKASAKRVPVDTMMEVLELFDTREPIAKLRKRPNYSPLAASFKGIRSPFPV